MINPNYFHRVSSRNKKIIHLLKWLVALFIIWHCFWYVHYRYGSRLYYSKEEIRHIVETIRNAPAYSDSFYIIYDQLYKGRHETISRRYLKEMVNNPMFHENVLDGNFQLLAAGSLTKLKIYYKKASVCLAFRISEEVSPEECFNYVMYDNYTRYCKAHKLNTDTALADGEGIIRFLAAHDKSMFYRGNETKLNHKTDSLNAILCRLKTQQLQ